MDQIEKSREMYIISSFKIQMITSWSKRRFQSVVIVQDNHGNEWSLTGTIEISNDTVPRVTSISE